MQVRCDLCGYTFDPACAEVQSCHGCPLSRGCERTACPRCGYPVLGEADLLRWLRLLKENLHKQIAARKERGLQ